MAQSAAAAFNPAHRLIHQFAEAPVQHGLSWRKTGISIYVANQVLKLKYGQITKPQIRRDCLHYCSEKERKNHV